MKIEREESLVRPAGFRAVLAFVLPAIVGVAVVTGVIAWKQELFASRTPLYAFADTATGITKGMPVRIFGITVGSVGDVEIVPGKPGGQASQVRIRFDISNEYLRHISLDSKARLAREQVVGQGVIEIVPGTPQSRPVARNEVIGFERGKSLGELSEELNKAVAPVLAQVKESLADLRSPDGALQKSVGQVNVFLQGLPETNRKLQKLMESAERAVSTADGAVGRAAVKAENAMGEIEKTAGVVSAAAPGILLKIDRAAESVARTSEATRKLAEESSRRVPLLIEDGANVVQDARDLMGGAKQSWPLRSLLPAPEVKTLPIDSQETSSKP
ncbi:MAG: MCE family protein [Betaproteobacteria bacterium]|nr:MCE family protein [Betaproteobacteria bacterium]